MREEEMVKKKRERERGGGEEKQGEGGGGEVRLKTDQQPERLSTVACLGSDFHSNFYAQSDTDDDSVFTRLSLSLAHARARERTSRRRWILRESWSRVAVRADPGSRRGRGGGVWAPPPETWSVSETLPGSWDCSPSLARALLVPKRSLFAGTGRSGSKFGCAFDLL